MWGVLMGAKTYCRGCIHKEVCGWYPREGCDRFVSVDDIAEVKHGRWMFSLDHSEGICTVCQYKIWGRPYNNTYLIVPYNYCPNCGSKMDGKEAEDADNSKI